MSVLYRCRLCLKSARNKIPIFKDDFPKMIEILTGLKVDPNDDFPKTSCIDCANNIKIALRTRKLIIQSHKTLLEEFLAKCKELDGYNRAAHPEIINTNNEENLVKTDSTSINLDSRTTDECGVTELDDLSSNLNNGAVRLQIRPLRTITKRNSIVNSCKKSRQDSKHLIATEELTSKKSIVNNDNMQKNEDSDKEYDCDDLNWEAGSSMSDSSASDIDWTPGRQQEKKADEHSVRSEEKKLKPILKASDGVFFVKKQNSSIARKKKTAETVIRIKKKPKDRKPPARVTCEICRREVQSYWLQKHMETHEYNPATCEFCGLISKSATALRHHVFYYHRSSADEYICDQCGRNFRSKYRLNLHKKKEHGGTKDFECTTCGKKFFERMHLKRHVDKTHKNIRPYVCDFCGKTFKSRNHIKIHERIHSKEAPYNCHMCGESFKMKLTLRTHLKGVHNVQELQTVFCDICKRGFASDLALKAHVNSRIHETEKCQYCSDMFTREYMINHLRDIHGVGAATT